MTRRIIFTLCAICFCLVTQAQVTFESIQRDLIEGFTNGNPNQILNSIGDSIQMEINCMLCSDGDEEFIPYEEYDSFSKEDAERSLELFSTVSGAIVPLRLAIQKQLKAA